MLPVVFANRSRFHLTGSETRTLLLSAALGVPVIPLVSSTGRGVPELRARVISMVQAPVETKPRLFGQFPGPFRIEATRLADLLAEVFQGRRVQATAEALLILSNEKALASSAAHYPPRIQEAVAAAGGGFSDSAPGRQSNRPRKPTDADMGPHNWGGGEARPRGGGKRR